MATGTVSWVNASKGHAFITPDEGGQDLFVEPPLAAAPALLFAGAAVEFDLRQNAKGRIAATDVALSSRLTGKRERRRTSRSWEEADESAATG